MQISITLSTGTYIGNPSDRQILSLLSAVGIDITEIPTGELAQYNEKVAKVLLSAIANDGICAIADNILSNYRFTPTLPRLLDEMPISDIMTLLTTLFTALTFDIAKLAATAPESAKIAETAVSN
jgi:hypothetical protein